MKIENTKEYKELLFVNFILKRTDKYTKETKVWESPITSPFNDFNSAYVQIELMRKLKDFDVVSAWISAIDSDGLLKIVYHDCYVDFVGNVEKLKHKEL